MNNRIYALLAPLLLLALAAACGGGSGEEPIPVLETATAPPTQSPEPAAESVQEPTAEPAAPTAEATEQALDDSQTSEMPAASEATALYEPDGNPCLRDIMQPCIGCGGGGGEQVVSFAVPDVNEAVISKLTLSDSADTIAFLDPAGQLALADGWASDLQILDLPAGTSTQFFDEQFRSWRLAVNDQAGQLAVLDLEGRVWLWERDDLQPAAGRLLVDRGTTGLGETYFRDIALSPDGRLLAIGGFTETPGANLFIKSRWGVIHIFDIASGTELQRLEGEFVSRMREVEIERDGQVEITFAPGVMKNGHAAPVDWLAFSPDSQALISANYDLGSQAQVTIEGTGSTIRIWDVATGEHLRCLETGSSLDLTPPALSPDGREIATTSAGQIAIWDATSSRVKQQIELPQAVDLEISELVYSPDGRSLIGLLPQELAARVWDSATGDLRALLRHPARVTALAVHPNSREILTVSDDEAWLWAVDHPLVERAATAQSLIDDGLRAAARGDIDTLLLAFSEAQNLEPNDEILLRPKVLQTACHTGVLHGSAAGLLDICEQALSAAAAAGYSDWQLSAYYESRGIARALSGDYEGAIADFESVIEASFDSSRHEAWIELLRAGNNPFDEETLAALRAAMP